MGRKETMKYFGIKTPGSSESPSYIWWIEGSEHNSWLAFFEFPSKEGNVNPHRLPLEEAIRAYKAIGYKCIEVEVKEKS
jgi:hypothetical protein